MRGDSNDPAEWISYADVDLAMAGRALGEEPRFPEMACFHAQQCAEKCLKAYLVTHRIEFVRTHSLVYLVRLCTDRDGRFSEVMDIAARLQNYAALARYPTDEFEPPGMEEAEQACDDAKTVREFVLDKMRS